MKRFGDKLFYSVFSLSDELMRKFCLSRVLRLRQIRREQIPFSPSEALCKSPKAPISSKSKQENGLIYSLPCKASERLRRLKTSTFCHTKFHLATPFLPFGEVLLPETRQAPAGELKKK